MTTCIGQRRIKRGWPVSHLGNVTISVFQLAATTACPFRSATDVSPLRTRCGHCCPQNWANHHWPAQSTSFVHRTRMPSTCKSGSHTWLAHVASRGSITQDCPWSTAATTLAVTRPYLQPRHRCYVFVLSRQTATPCPSPSTRFTLETMVVTSFTLCSIGPSPTDLECMHMLACRPMTVSLHSIPAIEARSLSGKVPKDDREART